MGDLGAGVFVVPPQGVILHGTRSGQDKTVDQEYTGTVSFAANGAGGLGWHATIGEDAITEHMRADEWGWNARAASPYYIALEFSQARLGDEITDGQVRAAAWYIAKVIRPRWPRLPLIFRTHAELDGVDTGAYDGKTDTHPKRDPGADRLRARLRAELATYGVRA